MSVQRKPQVIVSADFSPLPLQVFYIVSNFESQKNPIRLQMIQKTSLKLLTFTKLTIKIV